MFENFDKKSKLQTLKLLNFDESLYQYYKYAMNLSNQYSLEKFNETNMDNGTGQKYLMSKREPCT